VSAVRKCVSRVGGMSWQALNDFVCHYLPALSSSVRCRYGSTKTKFSWLTAKK